MTTPASRSAAAMFVSSELRRRARADRSLSRFESCRPRPGPPPPLCRDRSGLRRLASRQAQRRQPPWRSATQDEFSAAPDLGIKLLDVLLEAHDLFIRVALGSVGIQVQHSLTARAYIGAGRSAYSSLCYRPRKRGAGRPLTCQRARVRSGRLRSRALRTKPACACAAPLSPA